MRRYTEADVVWTFEPEDAPRALGRGQVTNHWPGMEWLTNKRNLAVLAASSTRQSQTEGGGGGISRGSGFNHPPTVVSPDDINFRDDGNDDWSGWLSKA